MQDTERLLGELKEFKANTVYELRQIRMEIHRISHWRWRITGALVAMMAMSEIMRIWIKN